MNSSFSSAGEADPVGGAAVVGAAPPPPTDLEHAARAAAAGSIKPARSRLRRWIGVRRIESDIRSRSVGRLPCPIVPPSRHHGGLAPPCPSPLGRRRLRRPAPVVALALGQQPEVLLLRGLPIVPEHQGAGHVPSHVHVLADPPCR